MGVLSQGSRLRRVWSWIFIIAAVSVRVAECRECSESEFRDSQGVCTECMKCAPGTELSQECGRGLGGQASCMPCPSRRYKEAWGPQRCLLCLDCALLNRAHAHNCTHTHNAVCGECVQGFYRKTRLGGFQDSECVSCASSPPADRTQCGQRVSVVRVSHGDTLSDERAVTGVVCGVLATILVAVSAFCLVYWKHHLAHKLAHHQQQQQQQRDGAVEAQEEEPDDDAAREEEEDVARALAPGEGTLGEGTPPGKKGTPPGKKGTPPGRSGDPHGEELVPLKPPHTALAVCDGPSSLRSLQPDFTAAAPCAHCCLHHGGPDPNHNPYLLGRAVAAGNRASRGRPRGGGGGVVGEDPVRCGCCEDPARGEGVGGDWGVRGAAGGGARWRLATEHSEPPATGCDLPTGPCDDSLHKGHVTPPGMLGRGAAAAPLLCSQHAPLPVCHCEGCPMGRLAVGVRGRAAANQEIRVDL